MHASLVDHLKLHLPEVSRSKSTIQWQLGQAKWDADHQEQRQ
jgi:hypothetical protein